MAINAYTGLMGSGKSFEVVSSVIIPALSAGRRVVTNIDGINPDLIRDYIEDIKKIESSKQGELICVSNDDVTQDNFFPDDKDSQFISVVRPGDLVAVDEVWQFWSQEHKISDRHMTFFRMHRHYTNEKTGVSCDLALMIQDLGTLHRKIRVIIEMTSRTVKLKTLGAPTAYRVELYEGHKTTKTARIDTLVKKYDKQIFPLYSSYASGSGSEKSIDSRQNILSNPRIWWTMGACLLIVIYAAFKVSDFFAQGRKKTQDQAALVAVGSVPAAGPIPPVSPAVYQPSSSDFSDLYRYVGSMTARGVSYALIVDLSGRLRVESPTQFAGQGMAIFGSIDSKRVTVFSGSLASGSRQDGATPSPYPSPLPGVSGRPSLPPIPGQPLPSNK